MMALTHLKSLQANIYDTAYQKGWYEEERTFGDRIALITSELSEALEEFRNGHHFTEVYFVHAEDCPMHPRELIDPTCPLDCVVKPEGVMVELADAFIRILDWVEAEGGDLGSVVNLKMLYNETRPHRHGGKKL